MFRGVAQEVSTLNLDPKERETIRQYLLGQAPQEDSSRLEEQLLTDGALYEELLIAEDELIDQYLSDKLSQPERHSLETHFLLAPERKQRLRFAQALHKYVDFAGTSEAQENLAAESLSHEEPDGTRLPAKRNFFSFLPITNPIVSYSLAAAIFLMVGGLSWVIFNNWRQQTQQESGNVYVATLTPGLTRDGGELKRISIAPGTDRVQLRLLLSSDEPQTYRAEVLTSERTGVVVIDDLKPQTQDSQRFITITLPITILKHDDYQVRVSRRHADGSYEEIGRYQFRVVD